MKRPFLLYLFIGLIAFIVAVNLPLQPHEDINLLRQTLKDLRTDINLLHKIPDFEKLQRCTVIIKSDTSFGSGVIISPDGLILTAGHVAEKENKKVVFDDGSEYNIISSWTDDKYDIGFVEIDVNNFDFLLLASSVGTIGNIVYLCGTPDDISLFSTISLGIISFINRDFFSWKDCVQVDAEGTYGCSGGPLINFNGEVIGICVSGIPGVTTICEPSTHIEKALENYYASNS